MGCVTSAQFVVLINGSTSNFFNSSRSLRHGSPLSPYLVLLVVEGLSRIMKEAIGCDQLRGEYVGRSMAISHLLFFDDVHIFCLGEEEYLR
jgi:hypothetical protein